MKPVPRHVLGIDASRMSEQRTGVEGYLHNLLPDLCRLWLAGPPGSRDVKVFARDGAVAAHVAPPPEVVPGGGRGWTQVRLPGALRRESVSVYFTPIPILPLARDLPCPAVVTVHDLLEFRPRWWYFGRLVGATVARAAAVVCVSEATRQELLAEFPAVEAKTLVVHEGADPDMFHPAVSPPPAGPVASATLARLGVTRRPLLAVGTIQPRKNYDRLISAYAGAVAEDPTIPPLVIAGGAGWGDPDATMALPARLGVQDRVRFAGYVDTAELGDLMRSSHLLLALSIGEGFGLPLVEAMYSGLPILASDIPVFREVAGTAARFVSPLDEGSIVGALLELLRSPAALAEMSAAGLGRRQLFSWPAAAASIVETLQRALTSL